MNPKSKIANRKCGAGRVAAPPGTASRDVPIAPRLGGASSVEPDAFHALHFRSAVPKLCHSCATFPGIAHIPGQSKIQNASHTAARKMRTKCVRFAYIFRVHFRNTQRFSYLQ